jgi:DNA-binding NarL/FixJ family response regulator
MPVRVFHGDDSSSFRFLIREVLADGDVEVVGQAGTPEETIEGAVATRPDVVVLDQIDGPELVDRLREAVPGVRVVVLSGHAESDGNQALRKRADAWVQKGSDFEVLRRVILDIAAR